MVIILAGCTVHLGNTQLYHARTHRFYFEKILQIWATTPTTIQWSNCSSAGMLLFMHIFKWLWIAAWPWVLLCVTILQAEDGVMALLPSPKGVDVIFYCPYLWLPSHDCGYSMNGGSWPKPNKGFRLWLWIYDWIDRRLHRDCFNK